MKQLSYDIQLAMFSVPSGCFFCHAKSFQRSSALSKAESKLERFCTPSTSPLAVCLPCDPGGDILSDMLMPAAVALQEEPPVYSCFALSGLAVPLSSAPTTWGSDQKTATMWACPSANPPGTVDASISEQVIRLGLWFQKLPPRLFPFPWLWDMLPPPGSDAIVSLPSLVSFPIQKLHLVWTSKMHESTWVWALQKPLSATHRKTQMIP